MAETDIFVDVMPDGHVSEIVSNLLAWSEKFRPSRIVGKGVLEAV